MDISSKTIRDFSLDCSGCRIFGRGYQGRMSRYTYLWTEGGGSLVKFYLVNWFKNHKQDSLHQIVRVRRYSHCISLRTPSINIPFRGFPNIAPSNHFLFYSKDFTQTSPLSYSFSFNRNPSIMGNLIIDLPSLNS